MQKKAGAASTHKTGHKKPPAGKKNSHHAVPASRRGKKK